MGFKMRTAIIVLIFLSNLFGDDYTEISEKTRNEIPDDDVHDDETSEDETSEEETSEEETSEDEERKWVRKCAEISDGTPCQPRCKALFCTHKNFACHDGVCKRKKKWVKKCKGARTGTPCQPMCRAGFCLPENFACQDELCTSLENIKNKKNKTSMA